jgi:hypothetical protein
MELTADQVPQSLGLKSAYFSRPDKKTPPVDNVAVVIPNYGIRHTQATITRFSQTTQLQS